MSRRRQPFALSQSNTASAKGSTMHAPPQRTSGEGAATEPQLKRGQKPTTPKSPLGPSWTSLSRLMEQVKDALVVLNQPLRYVAPLRRMQGIIFRGADKLPEWGPESAHSNRGAFLQSHQYRRRDIRLIERFRICQ